jgi:outer membrane receptor protein involved in Fe transport
VDEDLALYGSAARTFKAPNIDDLDAVLPPYNDSVNVKPQQADHYELGIRWNAADWMRVKGAGFVVHTKDEILFDTFAFSNANFTTRRAGLELDLRGKINQLHGTSYYVTHTLNQARFHKGGFTGNSIPLTPMHRLTAGLRAPITDRLTADLDLVWVGKQFRTNDFNNQFLADKYGVVNGGLEYIMPKKLFPRKFQSKWIPETKIYFQVLNLLDEEYSSFEASAGTSLSTGENPAPPRTWLVGASWEI